jgi:hypothetical protein
MTKTNRIDNVIAKIAPAQFAISAVLDAAVIRLCADLTNAREAVFALTEADGRDMSGIVAPIAEAIHDMLNRLVTTPAASLAALRAKAAVLLLVPRDDLAESLATDVVALA